MKSLIKFFALSLLLLLLEQTLMNNIWNNLPTLNIIPILILFMAFYKDSLLALLFCCLLGLLRDFIIASLTGPGVAAAAITYFCLNSFSTHLFIKSRLVLFLTAFFSCLLFLYTESLYYYLFLGLTPNHWMILSSSLFSAFFTLLLIPLLRKYFVTDKKL